MTPNEITTEIAVQLKKELDDVFKLILFQKVGNWRARLIRNSLEKKPQEAKFFMQTLYVPMEAKKPDTGCIAVPGLCPVAISTKDLPAPMRYSNTLFDFVGSVDGRTNFAYGTVGVSDYLSTGKYSKNQVFYDWMDNRLIVGNYPNLPMALVRGIFDKPEDVMEFNCKTGVDCDYWDKEYPITRDMLQQIVEYIVQGYKDPLTNVNKQIEVNPQPVINEPDGR
jgi:hypothetical protein